MHSLPVRSAAPRSAPGAPAERLRRDRFAPGRRLRRTWSASRSPQAIVFALAAWMTLAANLTLWRDLLRIDASARGLLVVMAVAAIVCASTVAVLSLTAWSRWMKPVWMAVVLAAAVAQHFMLAYGIVLDTTMLANAAATNPAEAADLLGGTLLGNVALVAALPIAWLWQLRVGRASAAIAALHTLRLLGLSLVVAVGGVLATYSVLAPLVRNHMELRYLPNPLVPFVSAGKLALKPFAKGSQRLVPISAGAALGPTHAAGAKPPLLVLVVGETARADHFGLNGYARETTPELRAKGVLSFTNVWSCGTSTLASLPCMFSSLGKTGFAKSEGAHENLLDVVRAAGMAVLWIDNQAGCKGVCDRVPTASSADLARAPGAEGLCSGGECLDEALLLGLDQRIAALPAEQRRRGVLLVMHQMGSHGPAYTKRSPPSRKRFLPECTGAALGDCDHDGLINAYDNSIAYTDHVLAATVSWLQAQAGSFAPALLYVSDHGESLGEYGIFLHGVPYAFAPDAQKRVPMIAWLGDDLLARDHLDAACLRGRRDERLSHDNLYHSVLGLVDVATPTYDARLDVWSRCRKRGEA